MIASAKEIDALNITLFNSWINSTNVHLCNYRTEIFVMVVNTCVCRRSLDNEAVILSYPRDSKRLHGIPRGYRGLQGVTGGYKGLQGVTRGYRGLEEVTRGDRGLLEVTRDYTRLPADTRGYKG